ncbi:GNAT family N-acetyltransferase [Orrella sp. JC864]|uniref:GNAT family N-acetyltransferase n=1 Tax=Orrella sp. JC864 TaxID=3120298 RepID=UPI0012BC5F77
MTTEVHHHPEHSRFEAEVDGHLCVLDYLLHERTMTITHTGVPAAVGGRGIAADLTRVALDTAQAQGWKVVPACSYAAAYLRRHPQYQGLLA